ncbi:MAG: hypothetical protein JXB06_15085, partial [Spirochaetales bacterium]|nr:hypothetical protein [Spirochaetales bacterium]
MATDSANNGAPTWHTLDPSDSMHRLGVEAEAGLDSREAARRLSEYGPNELIDRAAKGPLRIFAEQFTSLMVLLL